MTTNTQKDADEVHQIVRDRYAQEWPTSAAIYLSNGQAQAEGALHRNPDWARTLKGAIDASLKASSSGREAGIDAAIEYFYSGPVAAQARHEFQSYDVA